MIGFPASFREVLEANRLEVKRLIELGPLEDLIALLKEASRDLRRQLEQVPAGSFDAYRATLFLVQIKFAVHEFERAVSRRYEAAWQPATRIAIPRHVLEVLRAGERAFPGAAARLPAEEAAVSAGALPGVDRSMLARFNKYNQKYSAQTLRRVETAIGRALLADKSTFDVIEEMMDDRGIAGVFHERWKIDRVVTTELAHAYNASYLEHVKPLHASDDDLIVRWVEHVSDATRQPLDSRVGKDSVFLHGQVRVPGKPFNDAIIGGSPVAPPNRPRDRGRLVLMRRSWLEKSGLLREDDAEAA